GTRSEVARQSDLHRRHERRRCALASARDAVRIHGYSVIILSAHSTNETKILGLPNFAPYSVKSVSVRPLARARAARVDWYFLRHNLAQNFGQRRPSNRDDRISYRFSHQRHRF